MSERRAEFFEGNVPELMAQFTRFIGQAGARSFEFGYEVDGDDPERDPFPGEVVTWYAEIIDRNGERHRAEVRWADSQEGPIKATADLLVQLGANVAILDRRT